MIDVTIKKVKKSKVAKWLPWPAKDANKYTRGKLVIIGGSASYPGAICLATKAGLKMGAGYVEAVCAPETLPVLHANNPNVVACSWEGWTASSANLDQKSSGHPCACLIGSGFDAHTTDSIQVDLVLDVLANCVHTLVIDGGALTTLSTGEARELASKRMARGLTTIITPHFGEAARLGAPLGLKPPSNPSAYRNIDAEFAQKLANAYGATVLLKGADSFNASPTVNSKSTVGIMSYGTSALAKAGTGDVLAGMVSALAAQGLSPWKAASLASFLHARAGRSATFLNTEISVCATDVADAIPRAIRAVQN